MGWMNDETGLEKCAANYVPLSPLSHLRRAADVFAARTAVVYGDHRVTYAQYHARCTLLASALAGMGVRAGDVVATLLPNTPAQAEAHFGVPACGGVLNTINTRLDVDTVTYIFEHGGARAVLCDTQFLELAEAACARLGEGAPKIIEVPDAPAGFTASGRHPVYEDFIAGGDADFDWQMPSDEWESLALNYTSGTTGRPKGVVYHHRGAYLLTMGTVVSWRLTLYPRLMTVVPLFHCNGWCHVWTMTAMAATVHCMRAVVPERVFEVVREEGITHFGGAPIVLNMLAGAANAPKRLAEDRVVHCMTAGAPPPAAVLGRMESMGCEIIHTYGLTETYGHILECEPQPAWRELDVAALAEQKARQGVRFPTVEGVRVVDGETGEEVPADAATLGEIEIRGNLVMTGYLKNAGATDEALAGGWFKSGDLAVRHPDGYVQIRDRAKDIIISGGENISSVEIENALYKHPAVGEAAVVAMPDEKWGETPCAFVELSVGHEASEAELIEHCAATLARFKKPSRIVFGPLPKTATGKIQKFELRGRATAL